jgi:hypothetical protein
MKKLFVGLLGLVMIIFAANLPIGHAPMIATDNEFVQAIPLNAEFRCVKTEPSRIPPWQQLNPPWDPNIGIPDFSHRNDQMLSMAVDVNGRIYIAYYTPWGGSGATVNCGWGVATSTDQGITWDNRVYYINNTAYTLIQPEIAITDNGKIYLWGVLNGGGLVYNPAYSRSSATCYNNPDSLIGVSYFSRAYRFAPECVTVGNGNQLVIVQYSVDRPAAYWDSVQLLFSYDTVSYYSVRFRPPGGTIGMTSIAVNVNGGDTMLTHAVECLDSVNGDWDVYWYHDTMGIWRLYGMYTSNPNNDRYPSVFGTQNYTYLAMQNDIGSGNDEILFDFSTDNGAHWDASLQNLTNDGAPDQFPRLYGNGTTIGVDYFHGFNQVLYNYSVSNGQTGTWLTTPEIVTDAASADTGYHACALLYSPSYFYAAWEDSRNLAADSLDIFTSRRVTPIGVAENRTALNPAPVRVQPNPAASTATIRFNLTSPARVDLSIYDASGRLVRNLIRARAQAGAYAFAWDRKDDRGQAVPNGVYIGRLTTDRGASSSNLILIK